MPCRLLHLNLPAWSWQRACPWTWRRPANVVRRRLSALSGQREGAPRRQVCAASGPYGSREAAGLANRTELQRLGYSPRQIQALTPMAEFYNPVGHFWYTVYQVPRQDLTDSWYTDSVCHKEVLPCVSF